MFLICLGLFFQAPAKARAIPANLSIDQISLTGERNPLVHIFFSLTSEKDGEPIDNLAGTDIIITENGKPYQGLQTLDVFSASDRQIGYLVAIDTRANLPTSLTLVVQGLESFINEMGFSHHGAVMEYTGQPTVLAGPSSNSRFLIDTLKSVEPIMADARLFDGLVYGVDKLGEFEQQLGTRIDRRVMILFTDGSASNNSFSHTAAESKILMSGTSLFVMAYGNESDETLKKLAATAQASGGYFFFNYTPDEIEPFLLTIARRLKRQYILTYKSNSVRTDGRKYSIRLDVKKVGVMADGVKEFISPNLPQKTNYPAFIAIAAFLALLFTVYILRRTK